MSLASYEVVGSEREWRVRHDGSAENVYATKESAFEAAMAAASSNRPLSLASQPGVGLDDRVLAGTGRRVRNAQLAESASVGARREARMAG